MPGPSPSVRSAKVPAGPELERLVGLADLAVEIDQRRLDQRRVHAAVEGLLELLDRHAERPLRARQRGLLQRPALGLDRQVGDGTLHLVEVVVQRRELGDPGRVLLGVVVGRVGQLHPGVEAVAGEVEGILVEVDLEEPIVEVGQVAAVLGRLGRRGGEHGVPESRHELAIAIRQVIDLRRDLGHGLEIGLGRLDAGDQGRFLGEQGGVGVGELAIGCRLVRVDVEGLAGLADRQEAATGLGEIRRAGGDVGGPQPPGGGQRVRIGAGPRAALVEDVDLSRARGAASRSRAAARDSCTRGSRRSARGAGNRRGPPPWRRRGRRGRDRRRRRNGPSCDCSAAPRRNSWRTRCRPSRR